MSTDQNDVTTAMSTNDDVGLMSPNGVIDSDYELTHDGVDALLSRARCCRDWPVLCGTRIGRCGYCGQVPSVIGPW